MYAPAPAPFPSPSPAPAPFPAPSSPAAPVPGGSTDQQQQQQASSSSSSSSEEEESDTDHYEQPQFGAAPAPGAPAPIMQTVVEPRPVGANANNDSDFLLHQLQLHKQQDEPANSQENTKHSQNLKAAAALIKTLDTHYSNATAENATTALDADEARSAARTAAEIVRRYTTRSHPGSSVNYFSSSGSSSSPHHHHQHRYNKEPTARSPMSNVAAAAHSATNATYFSNPTSVENSMGEERSASHSHHHNTNNNTNTNNSNNNHSTNPLRYLATKTPSSTADRMAQSHAQDVLSLSLELERTKQSLEAERIAHDDTKNHLAEERSKNVHFQQRLQRLEGTMETQRETLGRSGDALEEELERSVMRMEAAEEDAQLALDFAKDSEENREQMEGILEQAMLEIQTLREQQQYYSNTIVALGGGGGTPHKSIMKPIGEEEEAIDGDGEEDAKRSVHFSDPISYSNSPTRNSNNNNQAEAATTSPVEYAEEQAQGQYQLEEEDVTITTPSRPSRPLVSAGRKLLQRSHGKGRSSSSTSNDDDKTYKFEFTPEKSAGRRQHLRDQLKQLDSDVVIPSPASSSSERSPHPNNNIQFVGKHKQICETCKTATDILQASGKRLELDGHWWGDAKSTIDGESEDFPLDSLARQYCQSVEVKISRQKNEIGELESLCSFLEETVASTN